MVKIFLIISLTIFSNLIYSQDSYVKGYFIDNNNIKTTCYINKQNWEKNPVEFEYKILRKDQTKKLTTESVKEFGINNLLRYVKWIKKLDNTIKREERFLKVLIDGEVSLYSYKTNKYKIYYYNKGDNIINELLENPSNIDDNYKYKLLEDLDCDIINKNKLQKITYKEYQLVDLFEKHNKCKNKKYVNYLDTKQKNGFNFNLRFGINNSSFLLSRNNYYNNVEFHDKLTFRLATEAEFIIQTKDKNKWTVIIEPTFNYLKTKSKVLDQEINFNSIEMSTGLRRYIFIKKNSTIFFNSSFNIDLITFDSKLKYSSTEKELEIKRGIRYNFVLGLGYKYKKKYSIELRYNAPKNILSNYVSWDSEYRSISLILGYSIL